MSYITREENQSEIVSNSNTNVESMHPRNRNDGREVELITPER